MPGDVVELVDTLGLEPSAARRGGSTPSIPTMIYKMKILKLFLFSFSLFISSDEGDIIETTIVNLDAYKEDRTSYCKERASKEDLIWSEEFNKNFLSPNKWNYSTSNGFYDGSTYVSGWGNGELQYYTKPSRKEEDTYTSKNLFIEEGFLKIQPIYKKIRSRISTREHAYNFTSARINTKKLQSFSYPSKISICFKVPKGTGFWPAFWLMPNEDVRWPQGGEIDILENRGRISNISSSALHFGEKWNKKSTLVGEALIPRNVRFQDKFHSISLVWKKNSIAFYLDSSSEPYFQVNSNHPEFKKYNYPFNRDFYMILNVAVGGKYDDYWVDYDAFCIDSNCSNKSNPDKHRFIIDWIEYEKL